jgi:hypothetical protein
MLFLRPNVYVVYDELAASQKSTFRWRRSGRGSNGFAVLKKLEVRVFTSKSTFT